jgi:type II secretory pathway pseudopilin PulG
MSAPRGDRGETLVEVLVTVMIMGVAAVVLLGGLGTSVRMSGLRREQATGQAYVRAFAQALDSSVAASPSGYVACATAASYAGAYTTGDTHFTAQVLSVTYWNGTAFGASCTTDTGLQQVVLGVQGPDEQETLAVILRKPCRSTVDFPLDPPCS